MVVDLSQVPLELRRKMDDIFRRDFDLQLVKAMREQQEAAKHYHDNRPVHRDGLGEMTASIHPLFDWIGVQTHGEAWHRDKDLRRWVRKKEPAFRVRSQSGKIQVGWMPTAFNPKVKFHKTYANRRDAETQRKD